jgi:hypothetical protein
MFFLIALFLFFIYPYILYLFLTKYLHNTDEFINENQLNINNKQFLICINPILTQSIFKIECNPFCEKNQFNMFLTFEIKDDICDDFEEFSSIINDKYKLITFENINYIQFEIYINEKNNNLIKNIAKYIKLVYPTYSKILFIFYDKYPFTIQWLRQNITDFNNDTTRNYYMMNVKNILLKLEKDELNVDTSDFDAEINDSNNDKLLEIYNRLISNNKYLILDDIIEELI